MSIKLKILDRYILSEFISPFVFGTAGFVIIGIVDLVFSLVDMFINNGVPFLIVLKLLIFKIPAIMVLFIPMAALFSVCLGLIRFIKDSELTVLRTNGVSLGRIIVPIVTFGLLVALFSLFINEMIVPPANVISEKLLRQVSTRNTVPQAIENTFFKINDNQYFFVRNFDKDKQIMKDVMIYELTARFPRTILADTATAENGTWTLHNGRIFRYDQNGLLQYQGEFRDMAIKLDLNVSGYFNSDNKTPREMDSRELNTQILTAKKSGLDTGRLEIELHLKRAMPFAALVFVMLGTGIILLCVKGRNDLWGIIIAIMASLLSVGFYFVVMATFRSWARSGGLTPFMGAWSPDLLFGAAALTLLLKEHWQK
jgi:lipopolysaccharide export system permease protein